MMLVLAIMIALGALLLPAMALWRGSDAPLAEGRVISDPALLLEWRNQIVADLKRLHQDFSAKAISEKVWTEKKEVLINRFVSVEQRRLYVLTRADTGLTQQGGKP